MSEAGGPTTQSGIQYQNSIAALYLGRMLDFRRRPTRERVLKVRVEAPANVDDIHVWLADGSVKYIQAKTTVKASGRPWKKIWTDFENEINAQNAEQNLILNLTIGDNNSLANNLRACTQKAETSISLDEFKKRLTKPQNKVFDNILTLLSKSENQVMVLLSKVSVEIFPRDSIERDYAPIWMPESSSGVSSLFSLLRDHCASMSSQRAIFSPEKLREFFKSEHNIDVSEPENWGADLYRRAIGRDANVTIPGTSFSKLIDESFPWPLCIPYDQNQKPDFDDEASIHHESIHNKSIDLRQFPNSNLGRVVLVGGAGLGKSLVVKAIAARLAKAGKLPVTIKIPSFCKYDFSIDQYLSGIVNTDYSINIDWKHAAEKGRVVLMLDGLDEVAPASRQLLLERLKVYSQRYPQTPWLLTVRDATALNVAIEGEHLEVKSLDEIAVGKVISFYRPESEQIVQRFSDRLTNRPDLSRLVRIPLFLALLCTTSNDLIDLPSSRSELLEDYLSILLKPEAHKPSDSREVDAVTLRIISEKIAFEALARDEIGVDEKLLLRSLQELKVNVSVDLVIDTLAKCGMLERSGARKLYFPFPIIQEYLAGCFIAENRSSDILSDIDNVIKKPWAQALQFALERHPSPKQIIQEVLDVRDDAFFTRTRLLARSIINGMSCDKAARIEISNRLVEFWPLAGWHLKQRIGQMISEAFFDPLTSNLREALFDRYYLHQGLGEIVTNIDDEAFTLEVLNALIHSGDTHLLNLSGLQVAVDKISNRVFSLYVDIAKNPDKSNLDYDDFQTMMTCLMSHLNVEGVPKSLILEAASNKSLPLGFRLVCCLKMQSENIDDIDEIIRTAINQDGYQPRSAAIELLVKRDGFTGFLNKFISQVVGDEKFFCDLLDSIPKQETPELHLSLSKNDNLPRIVKSRSLVFAARHGSGDAMNKLLGEASSYHIEIFMATLSLLGHYQSYELAMMAAKHLRSRDWTCEEKLSIAHSLRTGLTTLYEMDSFQGGVLEYSPLHVGADVFEEVLEDWTDCPDLNARERLSYDLALANIGYKSASSRVQSRLVDLLSANDVDLENWEVAYSIGSAIRLLQRIGDYPPIEIIEEIILKSSHNATMQCFDLLATIGTRESLDMLLWAYNGGTNQALGSAFSAIEKLSGRLGFQVLRDNQNLKIQ